VTTALIRWEQRRGMARSPRPGRRTLSALAVLALFVATIALGVIDTPPAIQAGIVGLVVLVLTVISGRLRDAAGPQ